MILEDESHQADRMHAVTSKGDPFAAAIRSTRMAMIITDPRLHDNPIVFCNDSFLDLTGYERDELIGSNCRILQGPDTDRESIAKVREAIKGVHDISVDVLNYRKDGSPFWNALYVSPVIDESGDLRFFFASQLDVTDRKIAELKVAAAKEHFEREFVEKTRDLNATLRDLKDANARLADLVETKTALLHEVDHRVKNNLQMVSSLVMLQSRTISDEGTRRSLREMLSRIEALGTVHRRLYQSDDVARFDVGEFVRDLITDLAGVAARDRVAATFELETVTIAAELAAPLALIVNEVATNALKHAFPDKRSGTIVARVARQAERLRIEIVDDGVGQSGDPRPEGSFGLSLIKTLSRQLKADVAWLPGEPGTRVVIELPLART